MIRKFSDLSSVVAVALIVILFAPLPAKALTAPSNVSVISTSELGTTPESASAKVSWNSVSDAVGYSVYATFGSVSIAGSTPICDAAGCVSFLEELVGGQAYSVVVNSIDSDGGSSNSASILHTAVSVPTAPLVVGATAGNSSVVLEWRDPSSIGGQDLSGFFISDGNGSDYTVAAGVNTFTISGLVNGQNYSFEIEAINSIGTSSAAVFPVAKPVGVPATPTRPVITASTSNSITGAWTAPSDGGSTLTGYSVQLLKAGVLQDTQQVNANVLSATFTSLSSGSYTIQVAAINASGTGGYSAESRQVALGNALLAQSINFPPIADQVAPGSINLSATADSGLVVTLTASGACTLSGNQVSFASAGTCQIQASQPGNSTFGPASNVVRTFQISGGLAPQNPIPPLGGGGGGGGLIIPSNTASPTVSSFTTESFEVSGKKYVQVFGNYLKMFVRAEIGDQEAKIVSVSDQVMLIEIPNVVDGKYDLTLRWDTKLFWFEKAISVLSGNTRPELPESIPPAPTVSPEVEQKVKISIGTFRGFLAIYLKGLKDERVSLKIAGKWILLKSVPSNFYRLTRNTGAGFKINAQVFINKQKVQEKTLVTK